MSMFEAKNPLVRGRQDRVEQLALQLTITGSATSSNVVCSPADPGFVFLKTQGVDQITPALTAAGDSATYTTNPNDSSGIFQMLVQISESVDRVVGATLYARPAPGENGLAFLGSATGISQLATSIMLVCDSSANLTSGNLDCVVMLHYSVKK